MIPVDEALRRVLALARPLPAEPVPLAQAAGRVLARGAVAARAQPPFAASAMDGYAIQGAPQPGHVYRIIGLSRAGEASPAAVGPNDACRIFTGAPMPDGATHVVIQEDVTEDAGCITITGTPDGAINLRPAGVDFPAGFCLPAPRRLSAADLALLAAMNVPAPLCARRPEIAVIATGDELVMPGETPGPDQIIASNLFAIKALAEAEGAHVCLLPIARDSEQALRDVLALATGADVVVTIGGASVGDHDLVARVAGDMGLERAFHKIAMRPGKPLMSGRLGESILLGLPGTPVSAIVCGHLFLLPLLRALQGLAEPAPKPLKARLTVALPANGPRAHYMRATLIPGDGWPGILPAASQDSALLTVLSGSGALLIRPAGDAPRQIAELVDYLPI